MLEEMQNIFDDQEKHIYELLKNKHELNKQVFSKDSIIRVLVYNIKDKDEELEYLKNRYD
jgi:peptidoglycan hydrolase CwlO-like protein